MSSLISIIGQLKYCSINKGLTKALYDAYLRTTTFRCCSTSHKIIEDEHKNRKDYNFKKGPGLEYFINNSSLTNKKLSKRELRHITHPYIQPPDLHGGGRYVYLDVYGCPMNVSDAEIIWSILNTNGYNKTETLEHADVVLIVTCSIRDSSEQKIWNKVNYLRGLRKGRTSKKFPLKIGILGCMAERLKVKLLESEKGIDVVAGPDSYRDLPRLLAISNDGESSANVLLSIEETYADIKPVSLSSNNLKSYVSIMRGCDNICSYCIVPFTRGKERSRSIKTIVDEIKYLSEDGVKEVTLLGQNVNSYRDTSEGSIFYSTNKTITSDGFKSVYKPKVGGLRFAELLDQVSLINPELRVRFTSPHPKDFPDEVLQVIKDRKNICECIHLPAQCGSSRVLELMNRGYTRESYLKLVDHIRSIIPNIAFTSDFICGFCSETDEEFEESLSLIKQVQYDFCYIYPYSLREKTKAHRKLNDDVSKEVKDDRNLRMHKVFREVSLFKKQQQLGQTQIVLIEGESKRSENYLAGRNDGNTKVIIEDLEVSSPTGFRKAKLGDYVAVKITGASSQVLHATPMVIDSLQNL